MSADEDKALEQRLTRLGDAVEPEATFVDNVMGRVERTIMTPSPRAGRIRLWITRSGIAAAACLVIALGAWFARVRIEAQIADRKDHRAPSAAHAPGRAPREPVDAPAVAAKAKHVDRSVPSPEEEGQANRDEDADDLNLPKASRDLYYPARLSKYGYGTYGYRRRQAYPLLGAFQFAPGRPAQQAPTRPHTGTIAHWRFDKGRAGLAATSEGPLIDVVNSFKGTPLGEPAYRSADGKVGLDFDGMDDRVFVADHPSFALTKSLTLEAIIFYRGVAPGSVSRNCIVFRGDDRGGWDPYFLGVTRDGQLCFHIGQDTANSDYVQVLSPDGLPKGKWIHVAGTLEHASHMLRLFVDRKEVAVACATARPLATLDASAEPGVGIGSVQSGNWKMNFNGLIAEVRISDHARKPEEFLPYLGSRIIQGDPETIEVYFNRKQFETRLGGAVRVVDFDDIETTKDEPIAFDADRYASSCGIIITGADGQYVGRTFGFPEQFIPTSPPNTYAPGPTAPRNAKEAQGGHDTDVTFTVKGTPAAVAGFGAVFIDADLPHRGPSSLAVYDPRERLLAEEEGFQNGNGGRFFCGMVAIDRHGSPVPLIAKVHLTNGNSWPAVNVGEGVSLDDFVFSAPAQPPLWVQSPMLD